MRQGGVVSDICWKGMCGKPVTRVARYSSRYHPGYTYAHSCDEHGEALSDADVLYLYRELLALEAVRKGES